MQPVPSYLEELFQQLPVGFFARQAGDVLKAVHLDVLGIVAGQDLGKDEAIG